MHREGLKGWYQGLTSMLKLKKCQDFLSNDPLNVNYGYYRFIVYGNLNSKG